MVVLPVNIAILYAVPVPPTPLFGQLPLERHIVPEASGKVMLRLAVGVAKPTVVVKPPLVAVERLSLHYPAMWCLACVTNKGWHLG